MLTAFVVLGFVVEVTVRAVLPLKLCLTVESRIGDLLLLKADVDLLPRVDLVI